MNFANAFQGLVALLWIAFIGVAILIVVRAYRGKKSPPLNTALVILGIAAGVVTIVSMGLVFIEPDERGVVISAVAPAGYREQSLQPGLRWIIPMVERVERYTISRQTYTMSIVPQEGNVQGEDTVTARTSDGQEIYVDASVFYAIDPEKVVNLHIIWQKRYGVELVRPLARGIIRDAVSQFGVEEVYSSKRMEMVEMIRTEMAGKFADNGLILVDFVLRNITFSPEYAASVEQKQIAEQQAQQARFVVEQRRQEAEQARQTAQGRADAQVIEAQGKADSRIIEAEAEKQALELLAEALAKNPDLLTYEYIMKLAPGIQVMLVPNDTPYLLPLPTMAAEANAPLVTPVPTAQPTPQP